jgi:hypothetical protein
MATTPERGDIAAQVSGAGDGRPIAVTMRNAAPPAEPVTPQNCLTSENKNDRWSLLILLSSRGGIFSGDHFTPARENPWISFAESSLIKGLRRPSGPVLSCAASRLKGSHGAESAPRVRLGFMCRFLGLHVDFPWPFRAR